MDAEIAQPAALFRALGLRQRFERVVEDEPQPGSFATRHGRIDGALQGLHPKVPRDLEPAVAIDDEVVVLALAANDDWSQDAHLPDLCAELALFLLRPHAVDRTVRIG